jgi:hypothetical protein
MRRTQHVYVEGAALNPFSAVEQPSQILTARSSCELVARQEPRKTRHRGLSDVNGRPNF